MLARESAAYHLVDLWSIPLAAFKERATSESREIYAPFSGVLSRVAYPFLAEFMPRFKGYCFGGVKWQILQAMHVFALVLYT